MYYIECSRKDGCTIVWPYYWENANNETSKKGNKMDQLWILTVQMVQKSIFKRSLGMKCTSFVHSMIGNYIWNCYLPWSTISCRFCCLLWPTTQIPLVAIVLRWIVWSTFLRTVGGTMQPRFISNRGQKPNVDSTTSLACETPIKIKAYRVQHSAITTVLLFFDCVLCWYYII